MLRAAAALWAREIVKFVRDRGRVVGALVQPLLFWVLLGVGFGGSFTMPGGSPDVAYLTYLFPGMVALVLLFSAIFSTISVVDERQEGFLQAALVAPVPRTAIVLGIVGGGATLAIVQAALFLLLAPLAGLTPSGTGVLVIVAAVVPMALGFTALGFVMAWRLETTRGFHAVMNLVLMPLWFLSGGLFPAESVPAAFRWAMELNPAYYGVEALRAGLVGLETVPGWPLALAINVGFALLLIGAAAATVRRSLFD